MNEPCYCDLYSFPHRHQRGKCAWPRAMTCAESRAPEGDDDVDARLDLAADRRSEIAYYERTR